MFGQEGELGLKYEILKENHETLERDYKSCQEMIKLAQDTYELIKTQLQTANKELEVTNAQLLEECQKERIDKDKYQKRLEEAKEKLSLVKRKDEEDFEKMENKYVELADKFDVAERELACLVFMYETDVAASCTLSAVMSEISDTENEVNHNYVTEEMEISDEGDAEQNQQEECKTEAKSVNENQATREVSVDHPPPFSASPSSSSSSSSDRYEDVFKPTADWPDWAR